MRTLAARLEAAVYRATHGLSDRPHVERIHGAYVFVPRTVASPKVFKTGILLARAALGALAPGMRLLDMGSGSGVVGVVCAQRGARVTAVDVNPEAVRATRISGMLSNVDLDVREGDLFEPLAPEDRFDVIAFNPPFFTRSVGGSLEIALSGGPKLGALDRFLASARAHLEPSGITLVAGSTNGALEQMRAMYVRHGFRWRTVVWRERISERLVVDELR